MLCKSHDVIGADKLNVERGNKHNLRIGGDITVLIGLTRSELLASCSTLRITPFGWVRPLSVRANVELCPGRMGLSLRV